MVPYGVHVPVPVPYPAKGKPSTIITLIQILPLDLIYLESKKNRKNMNILKRKNPKTPLMDNESQLLVIIYYYFKGDIDNQISKSQVHVPTIDPPRFK